MLLEIKDIIDILLVAFILFAIYRILRRSGANNQARINVNIPQNRLLAPDLRSIR